MKKKNTHYSGGSRPSGKQYRQSNGPSLAMSAICAVSEDHPSGQVDTPDANIYLLSGSSRKEARFPTTESSGVILRIGEIGSDGGSPDGSTSPLGNHSGSSAETPKSQTETDHRPAPQQPSARKNARNPVGEGAREYAHRYLG